MFFCESNRISIESIREEDLPFCKHKTRLYSNNSCTKKYKIEYKNGKFLILV